jgi:anhydro-N-acetylmuramic acid kinase
VTDPTLSALALPPVAPIAIRRTFYRAIGLMSGTSLDGIDAALVESDGERIGSTGEALTVTYPAALRDRLRALLGGATPELVADVERELTDAHAEAVELLLARAGLRASEIDLVGFHGHTILHEPKAGRTWQIGDGARLAARLNLPVVHDFRSADVAAGGEGAPLVPLYHAALARELPKPLAVLNLGGVGNVTWIGSDGSLLAFDTGPGGALLDDWVLRHTGQPFDQDGALAASGRVNDTLIQRFLEHRYFTRKPPKSLDRDEFHRLVPHGLSVEDGAATLTRYTAVAVAAARDHMSEMPKRWLVTGGGRRNATLLAELQAILDAPVETVESVGWDGDALEAQAFGFLAVRSKLGLPLSVPGTTGVPQPMTGGRLVQPPRAIFEPGA